MSIRYHRNTAGYCIDYFFREFSGRKALTCCGTYRRRQYTYEALLAQSVQVAGLLLDLGCRKGDPVLVCAKNCAEYAAVIFAGAILGLRIVPVDVNLQKRVVVHLISSVRPRVCVTSDEDFQSTESSIDKCRVIPVDRLFEDAAPYPTKQEQLFERFPEIEWCVDENDVYFEIFTSGTTNDPKSVPLTHRNLISNLANLRTMCSLPESYAVLSTAPLSHALGITLGLFAVLAYGAHIVLTQGLDGAALRRVLEQNRVDGIVTVPAFLHLLKDKLEAGIAAEGKRASFENALARARRIPMWMRRAMFRSVHRQLGGSLKWIVTGAAPLSLEVGAFYEALGVRVTEGYGLTECLMVCVSDFNRRKLGTVGQGLPGQEIRIDENGEIWVAGPNVFGGYRQGEGNECEVFRDGWMRTGDIGRFDEEGYLSIVGRTKNVIIGRSGLNIYPEDIEAALRLDARVREGVVVNAARSAGDVYLAATVLLRSPEDIKSLDDIRETLNERLGSGRRVAVLVPWPEADFPRTPSSKVKRAAVEAAAIRIVRHVGCFAQHVSVAVAPEAAAPEVGSVAERIRRIVASVAKVDSAGLRSSDRLIGDLGLDSLALMDLSSRIELEVCPSFCKEALFQTDLTIREVAASAEIDLPTKREEAALYTPCRPVRGLPAAGGRLSVYLVPTLFRLFFRLKVEWRGARRNIARAPLKDGSSPPPPRIFSSILRARHHTC